MREAENQSLWRNLGDVYVQEWMSFQLIYKNAPKNYVSLLFVYLTHLKSQYSEVIEDSGLRQDGHEQHHAEKQQQRLQVQPGDQLRQRGSLTGHG